MAMGSGHRLSPPPSRSSPSRRPLAAEATRIKLAHLFDPMMAIHTSNVDPLPHQIAAVYDVY